MTPQDASAQTESICRLAPVIPVLTIHEMSTVRPLARALIAGGLPVLEVTLRTPVAIEAIHEMAQLEGGVIGAGTLLTVQDVRAAHDAGALFGVSPGATDTVLTACERIGLPLLPGAATATEVMTLLERGYDMLKFFPAEAAGGAAALASFAAPLPQARFCPTGGVTLQNAPDYLRLPNCICVGGSWVLPARMIAARDWAGIQALAAQAAALAR